MTQYERDFDRVSATVRKEVVRFEVRLAVFSQLYAPYKLDMWMIIINNVVITAFNIILTERKDQEFQEADSRVPGVTASVSATGESVSG